LVPHGYFFFSAGIAISVGNFIHGLKLNFSNWSLSWTKKFVDSSVTIRIAADTAIKPEGTGVTTIFSFLVTRSGGDGTSEIKVNYVVGPSGFNPANVADFVGDSFPKGTITFKPGTPTQDSIIKIPVKGDSLVEFDDEFTVVISLQNPSSRVQLAQNSSFGRILNDDFCHYTVTCPSPLSDTFSCISDIPVISRKSITVTTQCLYYIDSSSMSSGKGCKSDPYIRTYVFTVYGEEDDEEEEIPIVGVCTIRRYAIDTIPPVFQPYDTLIIVECGDTIPFFNPIAKDACGLIADSSFISSINLDTCPGKTIISRCKIVHDACGNEARACQGVRTVDTKPPGFTSFPANDTVICGELPVIDQTLARDTCDGEIIPVYLGETKVAGICPVAFFLNRTWRATDECGNFKDSTQVITVIDTTSSSLTAISSLNVSLDGNCMRVITANDLLINTGCSNCYEVNLIYPFGTTIYDPANKVDRSHLGYCMVFSVKEIRTGNSTWGKICVEDKFPPSLRCSDDTISCFELHDLPLLADGSANCSGDQVKLLSERWVDYGCDSTYLGYVVRTIWGSDQWNNIRTCESKIFIRKVPLDSISCPDTPIDLPCIITHQIGGYTLPKELKTPILIDKDKVTPAFLLSLQQKTFEFKDGSKDAVLHPSIHVVPHYKGFSVYQQSSGVCKISSLYRDEFFPICGTGVKIRREWLLTDWCTQDEDTCVQWIEINDKVAPKLTNKELPVYYSSPHDCGQFVDLPLLSYVDCNTVTQSYVLKYIDAGVSKVIKGVLPATHIWLPTGSYTVLVNAVDACNNRSDGKIFISIIDNTPPTPVCDEFTQVTVDPTACWASVAAQDLDNGSHDNCCDVLHFAAAHMDSIVYWRNYWNTRLEAEVGKTDFWKDKALYDNWIEDWINSYVFADTIHFGECGTKQVVLRVYEACGVPRYDPHVWPCSPHAWFSYNTYLFIGDFNFNWFDPRGARSCGYRPDLMSIEKLDAKYTSYLGKGYLKPLFAGAAPYFYCEVPFYFPDLQKVVAKEGLITPQDREFCAPRLYNDCMINVLVDDKQPPVVDYLEILLCIAIMHRMDQIIRDVMIIIRLILAN
jgi:hypothetical protein